MHTRRSLFLVAAMSAAAAAQSPSGAPAGPADPWFLYRSESPGPHQRDLLTLRDGTLRLGKALEWGTRVYLYDGAGDRTEFAAAAVERIERRSAPAWLNKPGKPDLTVAYVERTPRDAGWQDRVRYDLKGQEGVGVLEGKPDDAGPSPKAGQSVQLTIHIRNTGGGPAKPFEYAIFMDDKPLGSGRVGKPLEAGEETTVAQAWSWQDGQHMLRVELDTGRVNDEVCRWNNTFVDALRAQSVFVCVPRGLADAFARRRAMLDTFCIEDWLQYHVREMNWLFEHSIYPTSPQGILERVRIDRIVVVDDPLDPKGRAEREPQRHRSGDAKAPVEYGATLALPRSSDEAAAELAQRMHWPLLHELGRQLGLLDLAAFDTTLNDCLVREAGGAFVQRQHTTPGPESFMHRAGPFLFSELDAAYLNRTLGRPRGFHGDYQYLLPRRCVLDIRGNNGRPLDGVQVELYQRQSDGERAGFITDEKIVVGATGPDGQFVLPNRPAAACETPHGFKRSDNPFGAMDADGRAGLMLARLAMAGVEEYHFLPITAFNLAAVRGNADEYLHRVRTRFASADAPPRLTYTRLFYDDRLVPPGCVALRWPHWGHSGPPSVLEYRAYQRLGNAGDDESPWTLVGVVKPNPPGPPAQPHAYNRKLDGDPADSTPREDVALAVAPVTPDGKEGALSDPRCLPAGRQTGRCAATPDMTVFIPVQDDARSPMWRWTPQSGARSFGLRVLRPEFRGYQPGAAGAALDAAGTLIVADDRNHQLAWYERGELVRLIGKSGRDAGAFGDKPGEFHGPSDVAVDTKGRIYVADRLNDRVQVFDAAGQFQSAFGRHGTRSNEFDKPLAVCCAGARLAVTDSGNHRVQIFDLRGEKPEFRYSISDLRDPDRALCAPTDYVYICDRDEHGEWAILIFPPGGNVAERAFKQTNQGLIRRPRGLYYDGTQNAYFVNAFPLEVRWLSVN